MAKPKLVTAAELETLLRRYKVLLGLTDWTHSVHLDAIPVDGPVAAVQAQPVLENFAFGFNPEKFGPPENHGGIGARNLELKRIVIHELIHVVCSPWVDTYERKIRALMGIEQGNEFLTTLYNMEDRATDRLARTIRNLEENT